jgi:hypothetical protein
VDHAVAGEQRRAEVAAERAGEEVPQAGEERVVEAEPCAGGGDVVEGGVGPAISTAGSPGTRLQQRESGQEHQRQRRDGGGEPAQDDEEHGVPPWDVGWSPARTPWHDRPDRAVQQRCRASALHLDVPVVPEAGLADDESGGALREAHADVWLHNTIGFIASSVTTFCRSLYACPRVSGELPARPLAARSLMRGSLVFATLRMPLVP